MDAEPSAVGLPAVSPSASSPMQLALWISAWQQSFTGWQGQAEPFLVPRSAPVGLQHCTLGSHMQDTSRLTRTQWAP